MPLAPYQQSPYGMDPRLTSGRNPVTNPGTSQGNGGIPWNVIIPGATSLLGSLFGFLGKKNEIKAQNDASSAATAQQRADTEARAHAAASIYSKVLSAYGRSDLATPDEIYGALLKEPNPTIKVTGPSALTGLSGITGDIAAGAQDYYYRTGQQQQQQQGSTMLQQIIDLINKQQNQKPTMGGGTYAPSGGYGGAPYGEPGSF